MGRGQGKGEGKGAGKGEGKGEGKGGFFGLLEEVGNCIRCLLCIPVVGFILLIVGASFLASMANDTRSTDIKTYNAAVSAWSPMGRETFSSMGFTMGLGPPDATLRIDLTDSTAADRLEDSEQKGDPTWETYTPLKRTATWTTALGPYRYTSTTPITLALSEISTGTHKQINVDPVTSTTVGNLNCYTAVPSDGKCRRQSPSSYSSYKWCYCQDACEQDKSGMYSGSTCTVYKYLKSVCVKVDETGTIDKSRSNNDQGGCKYDGDNWGVGEYQAWPNPSSSQSRTLTNVPLMVRSNDDPYIEAEDITKGSLYFGMTTWQKFVSGMVCLVLGCIMFVCPICAVCYMCKQRNARARTPNAYHQGMAQPVAPPTTIVYTQQPFVQQTYAPPQPAQAYAAPSAPYMPTVQGVAVPQQQPVVVVQAQ